MHGSCYSILGVFLQVIEVHNTYNLSIHIYVQRSQPHLHHLQNLIPWSLTKQLVLKAISGPDWQLYRLGILKWFKLETRSERQCESMNFEAHSIHQQLVFLGNIISELSAHGLPPTPDLKSYEILLQRLYNMI
jgi:hypothetical protein